MEAAVNARQDSFRGGGGPKKPIVRKQNAVLAFGCFNTSALCVKLLLFESLFAARKESL